MERVVKWDQETITKQPTDRLDRPNDLFCDRLRYKIKNC